MTICGLTIDDCTATALVNSGATGVSEPVHPSVAGTGDQGPDNRYSHGAPRCRATAASASGLPRRSRRRRRERGRRRSRLKAWDSPAQGNALGSGPPTPFRSHEGARRSAGRGHHTGLKRRESRPPRPRRCCSRQSHGLVAWPSRPCVARAPEPVHSLSCSFHGQDARATLHATAPAVSLGPVDLRQAVPGVKRVAMPAVVRLVPARVVDSGRHSPSSTSTAIAYPVRPPRISGYPVTEIH